MYVIDVDSKIIEISGTKVLVDSDVASLYDFIKYEKICFTLSGNNFPQKRK